jgi:tryptophan halogenase
LSGPIERIVILGGGTAGWMAAAALAKALAKSGANICVVESDEIGTIGVGEASVPGLQAFNAFLGLDQRDFMRSCQATFKLGIEFVDWGAIGRRYMHSFTGYGLAAGSRQFHRLFQRHALARAAHGNATSFDDYNLGAIAGRSRRFSLPADAAPPRTGLLNYAFHFDAALYARHLRNFAERHGVRREEGKVVSVQQHADSGFIEAVTLADGRMIAGEFFIDCSGFKGVLIEGALRCGYEEWNRWLPCDRAIALQSSNAEPAIPFTRSTAEIAGWVWRIPLQHRVGNGYVYSSSHLDDDAAEKQLRLHLKGALTEPRRIRFVTGKRRRIWDKNCLSLGLAAGFLEPLESTSIHLIQSSLLRLITLFPDRRFECAEIETFNRQTDEEWCDVRDFIITHYKLTSRTDSEFWRGCGAMEVPERVGNILELFAATGRLTTKPEQLFTTQSWFAILYGQGNLPRGYDPLLAPMPLADLDREMTSVNEQLQRAVHSMPDHAQFVSQYCGAAAP